MSQKKTVVKSKKVSASSAERIRRQVIRNQDTSQQQDPPQDTLQQRQDPPISWLQVASSSWQKVPSSTYWIQQTPPFRNRSLSYFFTTASNFIFRFTATAATIFLHDRC